MEKKTINLDIVVKTEGKICNKNCSFLDTSNYKTYIFCWLFDDFLIGDKCVIKGKIFRSHKCLKETEEK